MRSLFEAQAKNYDFHDDVYGLSAHRLWVLSPLNEIKKFMKGRAAAKMLDLACGTGFIIFNVARRYANIDIDGFDLSPEMIAIARERRDQKFKDRGINLWLGDAEIPYAENKYDIITVSFGFRNFANKNLAVENAFKALKPGGMFIIQDLTKPERQPFRGLYLFYMKYLLPIFAKILGTEKTAAGWLLKSVLMMPKNSEIKALLEKQGFEGVFYRSLTFGIACMVAGYKPKE
jgi:demethylmenaquinone methyltransferase/2-methoxy-6-polyprenyl-1,4-benzoquinol methylase